MMDEREIDRGTVLQQFVVVGREFCAAVEAVRDLPRHEFLARIQVALARLYAVVFEMPWVEPETDELNRRRREITFEQLRRARQGEPPDAEATHRYALLDAMEDVLGSVDAFSQTAQPGTDRDVEEHSIAVALHDTYASVSWALRDVDAGARTSEIIDQLKWGFTADWGRHAVDTLRAVHFLMVDEWLRTPDEE